MRTYEVTVKTPALYGREGAGTTQTFKVDANSRAMAAKKGIGQFKETYNKRDQVGYTMFLTIVRVA